MSKQKEIKLPDNWDNYFESDLENPRQLLKMERPEREQAIKKAIERESIEEIAKATRERNFASPQIQQPEKQLQDGKVVDKPRSTVADPFTRGLVGALSAPVKAVADQYSKPTEYSGKPEVISTGDETADFALETIGGIAGMLPSFGVAGSLINSTRLIKSVNNPIVRKALSGSLTFPLASSAENVTRLATGQQTVGETAQRVGEEAVFGAMFGSLPRGNIAKNVLGTIGAGALGYGQSALATGEIDLTKENLVNAGVLAVMHATGMIRPKDKLYEKKLDPNFNKKLKEIFESEQGQKILRDANPEAFSKIDESIQPRKPEIPKEGGKVEVDGVEYTKIKNNRYLKDGKFVEDPTKVSENFQEKIGNNRYAIERMLQEGKNPTDISKALKVDKIDVESIQRENIKNKSVVVNKLLEDREFTAKELAQEFKNLGETRTVIKDLRSKGYVRKTEKGYRIQDEYKTLLKDIIEKPQNYDIDSGKLYSNPLPQLLKGIDRAITFTDDMWKKAIGEPLYKALGKGLKAITPKKIRNALLQDNLPQEYLGVKREALESIERWRERANELANLLIYQDGKGDKKLSNAEQMRLAQIIKGSITQNPEFKIRASEAINEMRNLKELGTDLEVLPIETYNTKLPRKRINELLNQKAKYNKQIEKLVKSDVRGRAVKDLQRKVDELDQKVKNSFKHGGEGYLKRVYLTKEQQQNFRKYGVYNPTRLDLTSAMRRKDIPETVRREMGEVLTASYPVAKAVMLEGKDISLGRFFEVINERSDWADVEPRPGFRQLPVDKRLGKLSGKYVEENIARDIEDVVEFTSPEKLVKFARDVNNVFKLSKTVMNPSTHFRNIMSQSVMNDFAGLSHAEQARLMPEALRAWRGEGKFGNDFKASGLKRTTFIKGEIKEYLDGMESTDAPFRSLNIPDKIAKIYGKVTLTDTKFGKTLSRIYQAEEEINKAILFVSARSKGKSIKEAKDYANKWGFDYGDVPRAVRKLRSNPIIGKPFITWTYKAFPRVVEAAITRPIAFWKYPVMFGALAKYSIENMNVSEEDWNYIQRVLPERMAKGEWLLLPWKDDNGKMQMLDLTYIMPYKDVYDVIESGYTMVTQGTTNTGDAPLQAVVSILDAPITKSIIELSSNKNIYNNAPIWNDVDTPGEKTSKAIDHIYKAFMPPLAPEIPGVSKGGYSYHKLKSTVLSQEDYYDRTFTWQQAFSSSFLGLKTSPIEPKKFSQSKYYDLQDQVQELSAKRNKVLRDNSLSEQERLKRADEINNQIAGLKEEQETLIIEENPTKAQIKKMISRLNARKSRYPNNSEPRKELENEINRLKIRLSKVK